MFYTAPSIIIIIIIFSNYNRLAVKAKTISIYPSPIMHLFQLIFMH